MKGKIQAGVVCLLMAAIGAFGVFGTLQAAPPDDRGPKESQRLRGMEGRAFLVDSIPPSIDGPYCYFFNYDGEWIDQRWPGGPGNWAQDSIGAKTPYTASAADDLNIAGPGEEPFVTLVSIIQEGIVTPARGKGVLQLEAVTKVYLPDLFGPTPVDTIFTAGHEIAPDECPENSDE